jgi:hypothetical protein
MRIFFKEAFGLFFFEGDRFLYKNSCFLNISEKGRYIVAFRGDFIQTKNELVLPNIYNYRSNNHKFVLNFRTLHFFKDCCSEMLKKFRKKKKIFNLIVFH